VNFLGKSEATLAEVNQRNKKSQYNITTQFVTVSCSALHPVGTSGMTYMFYTTNYQRYVAELALFAFLVIFGLSVNSQALVALGILVLSHCLPCLVLASVRQIQKVKLGSSIPTLYPRGYINFREKEIVELISYALMIGVSVGLLALSLQKIAFVPLSAAYTTMILGLVYIAFELSVYLFVSVTSKNTPIKKPRTSRIARITVALCVMVISFIEHQLIQGLLDVAVGLGVLTYVTYSSLKALLELARKNIELTPRGITICDVKTFLAQLPGVVSVGRVYFRRINEVEHELGAHLSLEHYLLENSVALKDMIKQELAKEYGVFNVTIELQWDKKIAPKKPGNLAMSDDLGADFIALGYQS